jgi:tetratricopeptide (TPR) repeat protein
MRGTLKSVYPDIFSTLVVPKADELVATPYRHGSKENAEIFFLEGMTHAMHNIATVLSKQGNFDDSKVMYLRTLEGYEKSFGPDHNSTLSTANDLANILYQHGNFEESKVMYLRALKGYEKIMDPNDVYCKQVNEILESIDTFFHICTVADTLPSEISHKDHEHVLSKLPSVYKGFYNCDLCKKQGNGWVYSCVDCGFDTHPHCVLEFNGTNVSAGDTSETL